jgi:hypothetical protein
MPSDIRPGISDAYIAHYGNLQSVVYEMWPKCTFGDTEAIMGALAANLHKYRREPGPCFLEWSLAWIRRETKRHKFLNQLFKKNDDLLFAAIARALFGASEDWAVEPKDLKAEIFLHLLQNPKKLNGLMNPRTAKPSSMLYKLTKSRMLGYRSKLGDRRALVSYWKKDLLARGCEIADPPEPLDPYEKQIMRHELLGAR